MLTLRLPAFEDGGSIPVKYTCDGRGDLSPVIEWSGLPAGAKSVALIMDDPDVPDTFKRQSGASEFVHWVAFNMPAQTTGIPEGGLPAGGGITGANSAGQSSYVGPCPPPQYEPSEHRYVFTLYALDQMLALAPGATKDALLGAMQGHILAQARYIGRYKRR
jgi:Raf kinase inhibitor-like YbhB/YbcL family protein